MPLSSPLPSRAATAYAELFETVLGLELTRSIATLTGSFAAKTVRGKRYWYYQFRDINDAVRQLYVGPDDERVRRLIERAHDGRNDDQVPAMTKAAIALGCEPISAQHFQVIRRMAEYGFFRAGGVLIGTHAFIALASALAVRWSEASRTDDVDFAFPDKHLEIALPASLVIDVTAAIDSLELGFLPTSAFNPSGSAATYVAAKHDLRIDFLTTRKRTSTPHRVPHLNVAMQPLPYMELLLEHPQQVAVLASRGTTLVNVPAPENLAIHKLLVAVERGPSWRTKSVKDLKQAAALFDVLARIDADLVTDRWRETLKRGPTWRKKLLSGRKALLSLSDGAPFVELLPAR